MPFGADKRDGPSGYHNGELLKRVKQDPDLSLYLLQENGIIGLIVANPSKHQICYFCLDPDFIGKGVGTLVGNYLKNDFRRLLDTRNTSIFP